MLNAHLQRARKKNCWSIEEASEKVNVSVRTYMRWEQGQCQPHLSSLKMLCDAFAMSPEELGYAHLIDAPVFQAHHLETHHIEIPQETLNMPYLVFVRDQHTMPFERPDMHVASLAMSTDMTKQLPDGDDMTRRHLLSLLEIIGSLSSGIYTPQFLKSGQTPPLDDAYALYSVVIPTCWHLYYAGEQAKIGVLLPPYLAQLTHLVEQHSKYQNALAGLAAQGHQLMGLLAVEKENFGTALAECKKSLTYAQQAGDPNLQVASLLRKVDVLIFSKRHIERLQTLQEALPYVKDVSPLLSGRVYSGLGEVYARVGQEKQALYHLELARETYPATPESDPNFPYTYANHYMLYSDEGLAYLHLGKLPEAWQSFDKARGFLPHTTTSRSIELECWQALTAIELGDLEQSSFYLQNIVKSAATLQLDIYRSEADTVYQSMQKKWGKETKVRELEDLFHS